MSTATLDGRRVTRAELHLPAWGVPHADVELDSDDELAAGSRVVLVLGDLSAAMTVASGGPRLGRGAFRLVGGAGGWSRSVVARGYASDVGVPLATVLRDVAAEVGETVDALPTGSVGAAFAREAGPASRVLQLVAPGAWRIDVDGVTRFGAPPTTAPTGALTVLRVDRDVAQVSLASDAIASLVPGVVVEGVAAADVVHTLDPRVGLRTTIHGSRASASSRLELWTSLVEAVAPGLRYAGVFDYRVVAQVGARLDLQPGLSAGGMPYLLRVRARLAPGFKATWALGSLCLVAFVGRDPARPVVVAGDDPDSPGWTPTRLDLVGDDDAAAPPSDVGRVVRYGDPIVFGSGQGVVTSGAGGSLSRVRA